MEKVILVVRDPVDWFQTVLDDIYKGAVKTMETDMKDEKGLRVQRPLLREASQRKGARFLILTAMG